MSGVTRHPRLAPTRTTPQQRRRNIGDGFLLVWLALTLGVILAAYLGVWPS